MTNKFKISVLGMILTAIFCNAGMAQENKTYSVLNKYCRFGFVGGASLYNRAKIYRKYGDYTLENKPTWSYVAGLEYDLFPNKKWSVLTGLLAALEPSYNVKYRIFQKDLYPRFTEDFICSDQSYAITSFSMPLLVRLNLRVEEKSFASFFAGYKGMYMQKGTSEFGLLVSDETAMEQREMFGLRIHTQDYSILSSFVIGTGFSYAFKDVLVKTNLVYVMNFQNTMEGEYQFGNLLSSPPTRGNYELSGNYVSLMVTASLNRKYNIIEVVK